MNYENLKSKTIFDFAKESLLKRVFPEYNDNNKDEIISSLLSNETENGFYLWSYAEEMNNMPMLRAIEEQFDMNAIYGFDPD